MILIRTPLRISFAGGGTDVPAFYRRRAGSVLNVTIDKYIYTAVQPTFAGFRIAHEVLEEAEEASDIQHPLTRACLTLVPPTTGVSVLSTSDVPPGTGLGSSSAFCVSLIHGLEVLRGREPIPEELARNACAAELDLVGAPIGKQDQYAASYGGCNRTTFEKDGTVRVRGVRCEDDTLRRLEERLLLLYLGQQRDAAAILARQTAPLNGGKGGHVTRGLEKSLELAADLEAELAAGNVDAVGPILHEAWTLKRSYADGITNDLIETSYEAARDAGAAGGKVLGAGGGGFLLLFCEPSRKPAVRRSLEGLRELPFRFVPSGSSVLYARERTRRWYPR